MICNWRFHLSSPPVQSISPVIVDYPPKIAKKNPKVPSKNKLCQTIHKIYCFMPSLPTDDGDDDGSNSKCRYASSIACCIVFGSVPTLVFAVGVALLGWSSFEFDTIQVNGECLKSLKGKSTHLLFKCISILYNALLVTSHCALCGFCISRKDG